MCGMARGADFYFCEAVLALRENRPGVTLEALQAKTGAPLLG